MMKSTATEIRLFPTAQAVVGFVVSVLDGFGRFIEGCETYTNLTAAA